MILARHWWLTPVILATQEAEIRRILVPSQPSSARTYLKKPFTKIGLVGVAQGEDPEFKPQYQEKKGYLLLFNILLQVLAKGIR
jgi:hypothetical protein